MKNRLTIERKREGKDQNQNSDVVLNHKNNMKILIRLMTSSQVKLKKLYLMKQKSGK